DCDVELVDRLPDNPPAPRTLDDVELVVIRTYQTVIDAQVAKTALDSVGIDSMIRSDNEGGRAPLLALTLVVQLLVRAGEAEVAEAAEATLDVEGIEADGREPPDEDDTGRDKDQ